MTHIVDGKSDEFMLPHFINTMVELGRLGNKTPDKGGFYKRKYDKSKTVLNIKSFTYASVSCVKIPFVEQAKQYIREGRYFDAFTEIKKSSEKKADFIRKILCSYVAYSFACVGEVTHKKYGIELIDKAMAYGFNWAPPTLIMQLFGGKKEIIPLLKHYSIEIPNSLLEFSELPLFNPRHGIYFLAK